MEHPILFSGPMVRAILEGRKTQTRRTIRIPEIVYDEDDGSEFTTVAGPDPNGDFHAWMTEYPEDGSVVLRCPYGQPGDLLWIRESGWLDKSDGRFFIYSSAHHTAKVADTGEIMTVEEAPTLSYLKQHYKSVPSIHMPRWASRLTLRITDVRVQRVQEITDGDAEAEGIIDEGMGAEQFRVYGPGGEYTATTREPAQSFASLWDSINAKRGYSWESNPWVWALSFERVE